MKKRLLDILRTRKTITEKFYAKLSHDYRFNCVMRKIQMYMRGDKRLSISRLIQDVKNINEGQRGGEPTIVSNDIQGFDQMPHKQNEIYFVTKTQTQTNLSGLSITEFLKKTETNQITNNCPWYNLKIIGSGGFATIYEKKENKIVYKVFHANIDETTKNNIKVNIEKLIDYVNQNQNLKTHICLPFLPDNGNCPFFYNMPKHDTNLMKYIQENSTTIPAGLVSSISVFLQSTGFVHGDVKLENILIDNDNSKIWLNDFDGVYIPSVTIHDNYEMYYTAIYAHPLLRFYIDFIKNPTTKNAEIITPDKVKFSLQFNYALALRNSKDACALKLKTIMEKIIDGFVEFSTNIYANTPNNMFLVEREYMFFDSYAFGVSVIHVGLMIKNQDIVDAGVMIVLRSLYHGGNTNGGYYANYINPNLTKPEINANELKNKKLITPLQNTIEQIANKLKNITNNANWTADWNFFNIISNIRICYGRR